MQVVKNHNSEYPIGILWNMGNKYAREMMLKIAIMELKVSFEMQQKFNKKVNEQ